MTIAWIESIEDWTSDLIYGSVTCISQLKCWIVLNHHILYRNICHTVWYYVHMVVTNLMLWAINLDDLSKHRTLKSASLIYFTHPIVVYCKILNAYVHNPNLRKSNPNLEFGEKNWFFWLIKLILKKIQKMTAFVVHISLNLFKRYGVFFVSGKKSKKMLFTRHMN